MTTSIQEKWDRHYAKADDLPTAARVVQENHHLLPNQGVGLELACGLAANSFLIARHGIEMQAWDISPIAVEKVNDTAARLGLPVHASACDVMTQPPAPASYDVIVASHFFERALMPTLVDALNPGGLMFYQTFTQTKVSDNGPKKDEWRLADGELLSLFSELKVLVYREEGLVGDTQQGFRNEALYVGIKK